MRPHTFGVQDRLRLARLRRFVSWYGVREGKRESGDPVMMHGDLWKYCTKTQWQDYLLSLQLTGRKLSPEKEMAVLYHFSNCQEQHYRKARIPKKNGGFRYLWIPDEQLAAIQRRLLVRVLEPMTVSGHATAYRKQHSVAEGVRPHVGKPVVVKMDVKDFFGSIGYLAVYGKAFPSWMFPDPVRGLFASLCCFRETLPQGAPTSPCISNLVMRDFDRSMGNWCAEREIAYTRYCDDLTFSGDFDPGQVIRKTGAFLENMGFTVNKEKTKVFTRGSRQEVTGLVVNEKIQVPRRTRRLLRQEWYYCKKFGVEEHQKKAGSKDSPEGYLERLEGKIRYVLSADPENREFLGMLEEIRQLRTERKKEQEKIGRKQIDKTETVC